MTRLPILLAAAAAIFAAPVEAADSVSAAAQPAAAISIPFDPPVGVELRYRLSRTDTQNDRPRTVSVDLRVTFARDGEGYIMTTRSPPPPGLPVTGATALFLRPYSLQVSREGEIVRMVDEAGYWAAMDVALPALMRTVTDPAARQAVETVIARLRALPPAELLALLAQNVSPILEMAGRTMAAGRPVSASEDRESVLGQVTQQTSVAVENLRDGTARAVMITTIPPDQLSSVASRFFGEVVPGRVPVGGLRITSYEERQIFIVSLRTGLLERWEMTRTIEADAPNGRGRTTASRTLRRLR